MYKKCMFHKKHCEKLKITISRGFILMIWEFLTQRNTLPRNT